ncbi:MAG: CHAD domain-containing protein [Hyphomicrobium sp.]|jgi:CHAD domain-containing protein
MAFRFKLGEPFDDGTKRIAAEQIERAQRLLNDNGDQATSVHETRKSLKRLRALLRLVRPAMGEDAFKEENARLRDIGLSLSGARDRHVLFETVDKLEAAGGLDRRNVVEQLRKAIAAANGEAPPAMQEASVRLLDAGKRLAELGLAGAGFDIVGPGLERSYRRARRAFDAAYEKPSDEAFHEWRKGAQAHWRQMTLLARAWPEYLGARALEARTLSQLLGDDHDLALLVAFINNPGTSGISATQAKLVEKAVRQRQAELRTLARPRGERLFAECPRRLRRSVAAYWSAAASLKDLETPADEAKSAGKGVSKRALRPRPARRRASPPLDV